MRRCWAGYAAFRCQSNQARWRFAQYAEDYVFRIIRLGRVTTAARIMRAALIVKRAINLFSERNSFVLLFNPTIPKHDTPLWRQRHFGPNDGHLEIV